MKVFISWSGPRSHAVAKVLREELTSLINEVEAFVSSQDIEKGSAWFHAIAVELEKCDFGIICVTPDNLESRWLHFEAGALAGRFTQSKVAPLLIDFEKESQLPPPLSQLQTTRFKQEDFFKLIVSLNANLKRPLTDETLRKSFERWWSPFESRVNEALKVLPRNAKLKERDEKEMLEEILGIVRSLQGAERVATFLDFAKASDPFAMAVNAATTREPINNLFNSNQIPVFTTKKSPQIK